MITKTLAKLWLIFSQVCCVIGFGRPRALTNQREAFLNQIYNTKQDIQAVFSALI
jgi:hypothetical protein